MPKVVFNKGREESATDSQEESETEYQMSKYEGTNYSTAEDYRASYFRNIKIKGTDTTDALPKNLTVSVLDIIGIVVSVLSYLADVVMDVMLAYFFYAEQKMAYFYWTVAFVALPSLTMTAFSMRWYLVDADEKNSPPVSCKQWTLRLIFLMLQMGPILRYIDSLRYAIKSNKHKNNARTQVFYYKRMIFEDADATLLRLFECFMEAAPQLVLQMYIFTQNPNVGTKPLTSIEILQLLSMFSSLLSMSWALAAYQRALRFSLEEKVNMTWCGTFFQVIWHFFEIGSRILALGLFASKFTLHAAIVCSVHYIVMVIWILTMNTSFCRNKCEEFFYNLVLGMMFIFCYFNPTDSPTRRRYSIYYMCIFLENTSLMVVWFIYCPPEISYKLSAMIAQFLSFTLGLVFMVIYYLLLHPTQNIKVWAHWSKSKTSEVVFQKEDAGGKEPISNL